MNNEAKLTEQEIDAIKYKVCGLNNNHGCIQIANTATEKAINYIHDWGNEDCLMHYQGSKYSVMRKLCPKCWQSLKQGVNK